MHSLFSFDYKWRLNVCSNHTILVIPFYIRKSWIISSFFFLSLQVNSTTYHFVILWQLSQPPFANTQSRDTLSRSGLIHLLSGTGCSHVSTTFIYEHFSSNTHLQATILHLGIKIVLKWKTKILASRRLQKNWSCRIFYFLNIIYNNNNYCIMFKMFSLLLY